MDHTLLKELRGARLKEIIRNLSDLTNVISVLYGNDLAAFLESTISPEHYKTLISTNQEWSEFLDALKKRTTGGKDMAVDYKKLELYKESAIKGMGIDHYSKIERPVKSCRM